MSGNSRPKCRVGPAHTQSGSAADGRVDAAEPAHCLRSPAALQDSEPEISAASESATPTACQGSSRQRFAVALEAHFDAATGDDALPVSPTGKAGRYGTGKLRLHGVTRHKRTQRFESHIWECKKQLYLGGFDSEALAAKAHDIMALRCKGGTEGEVLNFPRSTYADLLPLLGQLSREDVITALRNYSKSQTSKRLAAAGAGARKPPTARPARRQTNAPGVGAGAKEATSAARPKLSIAVRREGKATGTGMHASDRTAPHAAPRTASPAAHALPPKRFGGKVAPRRPPCLEEGEEPPTKRHSGRASPGSPASPTTPFARQGDSAAPVTPLAGTTTGGFAPMGDARAQVAGMRWQRGPIPSSSPPAAATAAAAAAAADRNREQYLLELYYQHAASAQQLQREQEHYSQLLLHHQQQLEPRGEEPTCGEASAACPSMGASACAAQLATARSGSLRSMAVRLGGGAASGEPCGLACIEDVAELELEMPLVCQLEEPEPATVLPTGADAMEHVNGTMLFQDGEPVKQAPQQQPGAAEPTREPAPCAEASAAGTSAEAAAARIVEALLSAAAPSAASAQPSGQVPASAQSAAAAAWLASRAALQPPSSSTAGSVFSAGGTQTASAAYAPGAAHHSGTGVGTVVSTRPSSSGQLINIVPAAAVPQPPLINPAAAYAAAFQCPAPPTSIASVLAASAAALQQAGLSPHQQQLLLQRQTSSYIGLSPFALYPHSGSFPG